MSEVIPEVNIPKFRKDLKEMTLEEALIKHNTNLKEVMSLIPIQGCINPDAPNFKSRYIQKTDGKFYLRRYIDKELLLFGTYTSLDDAIAIRECCEEQGWIQSNVLKYCKEKGVEMAITSHKYWEKYQ